MVKAAVIGGSGYTGVELIRLLTGHPQVQITAVTSRQYAGQPVTAVFPSLAGHPQSADLSFVPMNDPAVDEAEFVFTALPHQAAAAAVVDRLERGQRVIDLSADFRFREATNYEAVYCVHDYPDLCAEAVYGLPEIYADQIAGARLVAGPGCYPTCSILPLAPLLAQNLIEAEGIIINAASGVSGAGRGAKVTSLFSETGEDYKAYALAGHRHRPEMEQELTFAAGKTVRVVFQPHLAPMSRGMAATIYCRPKASLDDIMACWRDIYASAPFVQILPARQAPRPVALRGSNCIHLSAAWDQPTDTLILLSAQDNLTKGAAGQTIQCLNIMAGLPQETGLPLLGLMP